MLFHCHVQNLGVESVRTAYTWRYVLYSFAVASHSLGRLEQESLDSPSSKRLRHPAGHKLIRDYLSERVFPGVLHGRRRHDDTDRDDPYVMSQVDWVDKVASIAFGL